MVERSSEKIPQIVSRNQDTLKKKRKKEKKKKKKDLIKEFPF